VSGTGPLPDAGLQQAERTGGMNLRAPPDTALLVNVGVAVSRKSGCRLMPVVPRSERHAHRLRSAEEGRVAMNWATTCALPLGSSSIGRWPMPGMVTSFELRKC
jgi:hypothetical protein